MSSTYKELNISNPGTSSKAGGNDYDAIVKNFNGVIAGLAPVKIKNQNKFGFWDSICYFRNQADSRNTTIRGQSNVPATDVDLRLPPITTNDTLVALGIQNIFPGVQRFDGGIIYNAIAEPVSPTAGLHETYVDTVDGHFKKKNSSGVVKDYDLSTGGGSGEINTASNIGTSGVGLFKQKSTYDLQFKKINVGSSSLSIIDDTVNNEVDIDIPNSAIAYAKIQNVSAVNRILGRITTGAGVIEELTGTQLTTLLDVFTTSLKGVVPASGGGTTNFLRADGTWSPPPGAGGGEANTASNIGTGGVGVFKVKSGIDLQFKKINSASLVITDDTANNEPDIDIVANSIDNTEIVDMTANSVKGNATASTADPSDISVPTNTVLGRVSGNIVAAQLATAQIANDAIDATKLSNMAANTIRGNPTASSADPAEITIGTNSVLGRLASNIAALTGTQLTTILDVFTSTLKGLVPSSGGGTTTWLRADGNWAAIPPAEITGTATGAANGSATSFTIAHGLGATPYCAFVQISSVLASNIFYSFAYDGTNITVTFASAPTTGTITFQWRVVA